MAVGPYTSPPDPVVRCPRCRGQIVRVPRRPFDRVMSVFMLRWRYRCRAMGCGWEGTLRVKR
jgi:hypothetical protein